MATAFASTQSNADRNRAIIVIVVVALILGAILAFWRPGGTVQKPTERKITRIALPPPPPPPPPPPLDKPKPVEEPKLTDTPTPKQPAPDNKPQQDAPKATTTSPLTGPNGLARGDGRIGDRIGDCTGPNCGTGIGGGDKLVRSFGEYQNVMAGVIRNQLKRDRRARGQYEFVANVTVGGDGVIKTAQLTKSSGDAARDALIESLMIGLRPDKSTNSMPPTARITVQYRLGS